METCCNNIIRALDQISIAEIFSYLQASDVLHLSLTCKDFHRIVSKSPYITKSLFENLFGRNISKKDMASLTYTRFQEILKDLFTANTLKQPLPFFGYRGNCGCDKNNPSYLFDGIFEAKEERKLVCTDEGENFDIEGVLSEDYGRETKHLQNIMTAIDQIDLDENFDLYSLKVMLQRYGSWVLDLFPPDPNDLFEENIKPLREFVQERAEFLHDRNDKYHIELPCQKMMKSIGLIQSCHLMRETENLTCPVKSLVAFASVNEEIRSSPIVSLFSQCTTSDDLIKLLKDHKDKLPDISQTSIKKLAEFSSKIKYIDEEADGVEFVVFNSNGKKQDVIPLFWVNFNKPITKDLFLDFKDNNFSGRYVMLKLIQCDDLREGSDFQEYSKNIDFKFCCFYGPVINL